MTVIVYKNGVLASDGRLTEENAIFTNSAQKVFRLKDGGLLGSAGDADDHELLTLLNRLKGKLPTHKQLASLEFEFSAIWVKPDKTVYVLEANREKELEKYISAIFPIKDSFVAVGTGSPWALGALAMGASAEQAVKVAIKFDNNCGGNVQVLKLNE